MNSFPFGARFATGAIAGTIVLASFVTLALLSNVGSDPVVSPTAEKVELPEFHPYCDAGTYFEHEAKRQFVHQWLELLFNEDPGKRRYSEAEKTISPTAWKKVVSLLPDSQMMPFYGRSAEYGYDDHEVTSYQTLVGLTAEDPILHLTMRFSVSGGNGSYWIEDVTVEYSEGQEKRDATAAVQRFYQSELDIKLTAEAQKEYFAAKSLLSNYDRQGAINAYSKALKASPKFFLAYFCRGYERSVLGDHNGAIADYSSAIEINPKFVAAYHNRGYELDGFQNNHVSACADFDEVIRLQPRLSSGYISRARALNSLQLYNEAIRDCNEAIRLSPANGEAYSLLAFAHSKVGDTQCAIKDATSAIENYGGSAWIYKLRGDAQLTLGRRAQALSDYDQAIEKDPNFASAYTSRGYLRSLNGDHAGALKDHDLAVYIDPANADRYFFRGQAFARMGNHKSAIADYSKTLEHRPYGVEYLKKRAISFLADNEVAAAKADLDKAIGSWLDEELEELYLNRASANWRLGNFRAAISDYAQFQKMRWYRPRSQDHIANCHREHTIYLDATSVAILLPTLVLLALIIAAAHKKHLFPWQEPLEETESILNACKHCGHK